MLGAFREPALPLKFGRYELLLRIGSGGMASVYLARIRGLGGFEREVAIKITHPHLEDEGELVTGLLQEARIAARIRHPNVVPVLDVGEEHGSAFLVMDYVEGEVLSAIARSERKADRRVPLPIALRILADALAGLHAAHELRGERGEMLQIVHRDFSPQNILVGLDGAARLTDFGIARVSSLSSATATGYIKGKLSYLSPEQVRSPRSIDRRSDVWAAGVVAWELFTGRPLWPRDEEAATLLRIVSESPPRARTVVPDLPEALDEAVSRALQIDPERRLATADELRRLLVDSSTHGRGVAGSEELALYVGSLVRTKLEERRLAVQHALAADAGAAGKEAEAEEEVRTDEVPTRAALTKAQEPPRDGASRWGPGARRSVQIAGVGAAAVAVLLLATGRRAGSPVAAATASASSPSLDPAPAAISPEVWSGDPARSATALAVSAPEGPAAPSASASARPTLAPTARPRLSPSRPTQLPVPTPSPVARPALPADPLDNAR